MLDTMHFALFENTSIGRCSHDHDSTDNSGKRLPISIKGNGTTSYVFFGFCRGVTAWQYSVVSEKAFVH